MQGYDMAEIAGFKKWYGQNKVAFNKKRKDKYAENKEMRDKAVMRQREYRKNNPVRVREENTREVGGRQQVVYRIGAVAERIGRSEQVIRLWEKNNVIPKPTVVSAHRYYTESQVELLGRLAMLMDEVRYKPLIRAAAVSKMSGEIHLLWEN